MYSDETCVRPADRGSVVEVSLNPEGVAAINASAGGYFLFGIVSTSIDGSKGPDDQEGVRFSVQDPAPWQNQLELQFAAPVPALDAWPRLGLGLVLFASGVAVLSRNATRSLRDPARNAGSKRPTS